MRPAFVLGLGATGLSAVRSLGRRGIPVVGFTYQRGDPGCSSRYCRKVLICPDPASSSEPFIDALLAEREAWGADPVLIPAEDSYLMALNRFRPQIEPLFRFNIPDAATLECIQDKRRQFAAASHAGVPIPQTFTPANSREVLSMGKHLKYPAFIKGAVAHLFYKRFKTKGFKVESSSELRRCYDMIFAAGVDALVQPFVEGPASSLTSVCVYYSHSKELMAEIAIRKVRQAPPGFGVGTMVETVQDPELLALSRAFCQSIGYTGIAEIEFKRGLEDGIPRLMELNPRLWQQTALATAAGVDFPYLLYNDLNGGHLSPIRTYRTGLRWGDPFEDLYNFRKHRRELDLSISGFLRSWCGVRVVSLLNWADPMPFLQRSIAFFRQMARARWMRLRGAWAPRRSEASLHSGV